MVQSTMAVGLILHGNCSGSILVRFWARQLRNQGG